MAGIRAMILHCVQGAESGGENRVLDRELAYIALRDADPAFIAALMQDDVMTIPARSEEGDIARGDQSGTEGLEIQLLADREAQCVRVDEAS